MARSVRKSNGTRLIEATKLYAGYKEAGLDEDYRARFVGDMASRLERNKGLSKKQRDWLDSLVEAGVPRVEYDKALYQRLIEAQETLGVSDYKKGILQDFSSRIRQGRQLSDKQAAWAESMIVDADAIRQDGAWTPTPVMKARLASCVELARARNGMYWATHGGEAKAKDDVENWLKGDVAFVEKWSCDKMLKSFRKRLVELHDSPRFEEGVMAWTRVRDVDSTSGWGNRAAMVLVTGGPTIGRNGNIVYPALIEGKFMDVPTEQLWKRRPRG
jgi:hypothetical protein